VAKGCTISLFPLNVSALYPDIAVKETGNSIKNLKTVIFIPKLNNDDWQTVQVILLSVIK
jgi:hypothetical protein